MPLSTNGGYASKSRGMWVKGVEADGVIWASVASTRGSCRLDGRAMGLARHWTWNEEEGWWCRMMSVISGVRRVIVCLICTSECALEGLNTSHVTCYWWLLLLHCGKRVSILLLWTRAKPMTINSHKAFKSNKGWKGCYGTICLICH